MRRQPARHDPVAAQRGQQAQRGAANADGDDQVDMGAARVAVLQQGPGPPVHGASAWKPVRRVRLARHCQGW